MTTPETDGRKRVIIEGISPEVDGGRFPAKRTVGDLVRVEADIFTDGHDAIAASLLARREGSSQWTEIPMKLINNDRWTASFGVSELGRYGFKVQAWVDHFETWHRDLLKRIQAGTDAPVDYLIGADLIEAAAERAGGPEASWLKERAKLLRSVPIPSKEAAAAEPVAAAGTAAAENTAVTADPQTEVPVTTTSGSPSGSPSTAGPSPADLRIHATDPQLHELALRYPDKRFASESDREALLVVDPVRARFSSWYEFFPRSTAPKSETGTPAHGTFKDAEHRLTYAAEMGFNVVYLPPIHPIGRMFRKGPNNNPEGKPGDEGSPWAIGSAEGGHKAILPALGTLADFRRFVQTANSLNLSLALDIAFQSAPDHPYVQEHENWFKKRPDGTIQYAENPPKKYQDIYPFDFESEDWRGMWEELKSVFDYWIGQGVTIFRVDNPHTKAFPFWEWCITEIKRDHPEVLFLAEAFTRPKIMYRLAKLGFSQSYTYFPWRNAKEEITEYLTELTQTPVREFFRPNQWPNTPDILTEFLQIGGPAVFSIRLLLAATLGANYGIYGPAFEQMVHEPVRHGSEEYLNSEKYEVHHWDLDAPNTLQPLVARVNAIRNSNEALQNDWSLKFHTIENSQILCYSKESDDRSNLLLVVVNLDPHHVQSGFVNLPLYELEIPENRSFEAQDLLSGERYLWNGPRNYVELNPAKIPGHILKIQRRLKTETDFDYYL